MRLKSLISPKVIVPVLIVTALAIAIIYYGFYPILTISIDPNGGIVGAGESIRTNITVTSNRGGVVTLSASDLPPGVSLSFYLKQGFVFVRHERIAPWYHRSYSVPFKSRAIIATDPSTEIGVYNIPITATTPRSECSTAFTLTVLPPTPTPTPTTYT